MHFDNVQAVLGDFGEEVGLSGCQLDEEGNCGLVLGDNLEILISYDEAKHRLMLMTEICNLPSGDNDGFFTALLEANALGVGTQGATFALDREGESIVLLSKIDTGDIDLNIFADSLDRHLDVTERWVDALDGGGSEEQDGRPEPPGQPEPNVFDPRKFA